MTPLVTISKVQAYNANYVQRTYTFTCPANFGGIIIGGVCSSSSNYYIYIDNFSITTSTPTDYASISSNVSSVPCGGGNANITFNLPGGCLGPYNVTYTVNGTPTTINSISNGHTITLPISASSTVVLTNVTNVEGCSFNPNSSLTITTSSGVTANAGSSHTLNCTNPSVALNGSASGGTPAYSYSWSPTTGLSNPNIANPTASPSSTTIYTLTVTDAASCTSSASTTITVNNTPAFSKRRSKSNYKLYNYFCKLKWEWYRFLFLEPCNWIEQHYSRKPYSNTYKYSNIYFNCYGC
jgi:hypothetical protein